MKIEVRTLDGQNAATTITNGKNDTNALPRARRSVDELDLEQAFPHVPEEHPLRPCATDPGGSARRHPLGWPMSVAVALASHEHEAQDDRCGTHEIQPFLVVADDEGHELQSHGLIFPRTA